jgi:5-methylcytosine-specific restriction endonuclease McrA
MGGAMGYDGCVPVNAGAGDRQALNVCRRTSAALETGALFLRLEFLFHDGAVGIPSGMPVACDAGSWRTLSYRRHLDRQASGDGFRVSHRRPAMSVDPSSVLPAVPATKRCNKCSEEKPLSEFSKDSANKDCLQRTCKICKSKVFKSWKEKDVDIKRKRATIRQQNYRANNKEIVFAKRKAYRLANKDQLLKKHRQYVIENKDKIREREEKYKEKNRGKPRKSQAAYREKNKEKRKALRVAWEKANPEKVSARKRNRRARKRNAEGSHTAADIQQLLVLQKSKCAVCHTSIKDGYHVDHVIPLILGGGNGKDNLQLLCPPCNLSKNAKHPIDFMQERGMLL